MAGNSYAFDVKASGVIILSGMLRMIKIKLNLHTDQYASSDTQTTGGTSAGGTTATPWYHQIYQVSSQGRSRKAWWAYHTHQWFQLRQVESSNC